MLQANRNLYILKVKSCKEEVILVLSSKHPNPYQHTVVPIIAMILQPGLLLVISSSLEQPSYP